MASTGFEVSEPLPDWLSNATNRLRAITGFVTVHPDGGDPRTRAFCRYDHVARVASLALSVGDTHRVSRSEVLLFSWLHDINRWPFAHNAERDRFDQARDIERFVAGRLPAPTVMQAVGIAAKHVSDLDKAARVVLLADIATGLLEDALFIVTALNLSPSELPSEALDLLWLPIGDATFLAELQYLCTALNRDIDVPRYTRDFNSLVFRTAWQFLSAHNFLSIDSLENDKFWYVRNALRNDFLERQVFPLTNEKVCHGELIRQVVIDPVLDRLGDSAVDNLTRWTEADLIAYLRQERLMTEETLSSVIPSLDYIRTFEPHRSFI